MKKALLCEPNVSEGRDLDIVQQIFEPIHKIEGIRILDTSSDANFNRSVITYLGEPDAVLEATKAMARKAIKLIDMSSHSGAHPRMGAVDVVPFIPVRGVEKEEAIETSRQFGKYLGGLGVPVYYYEDSATRPERQHFPTIRKGEYESLEEKLKTPEWEPDEGPFEFNPTAGATVTGVRFPLVAFNINLLTTDQSIADQIARAVRHISGGYRYVQALGLSLEDQDRVQVSMNLINYRKTPLPRVLETVRSEAARHGVSIAGAELIGPVPIGVLEDVVKYYLQVHDFNSDQIVELALLD